MDLSTWIERYRTAWERGDADLVVSLFTNDASYRSYAFRDPHVGHDGIRRYWQRATGDQSDVTVRTGEPVVEGDRAVVEWWTQMDEDGAPSTVAGALLLRFASDGRCRELREYWHQAPRRVPPHDGWGR